MCRAYALRISFFWILFLRLKVRDELRKSIEGWSINPKAPV
jgi:hypothetical protein